MRLGRRVVAIAVMAVVLVLPATRAEAAVAGAPTGVSAVPGDAQASVMWTAPASDGGSPITGYTVVASPGGATASVGGGTTSAAVTGLTNGTTYTFVVTATNGSGLSPASAPSNPVTVLPATSFTCARWASATGSDANTGEQVSPVATLRRLVATLSPGQTGCVKAGETLDDSGGFGILVNGGTPGLPVVVRTEPGGAKATLQGFIHVPDTVHDVVIADLNLVGPPTGVGKNSAILVDGDRVTLSNNDITYPLGICVDVGTPGSAFVAQNFVLNGNRIHNCGTSPSLVWTASDSGAHGIYLKATDPAVIADNVVYDNQWRGIQTYPNPKNVTIGFNVFDSNASNVNIGQLLTSGYVSDNVIVRDNVITYATLWEPPPPQDKNPAQVHGTVPTDTHGNVVTRNCLFHPDPTKNFSGTGYTQVNNIIAAPSDPLYANRAAKDFHIAPGSPCAGKGPRAAAAAAPPLLTVTLTRNKVNPRVGQRMTFTATVINDGGTAATGVDVVFSLDPSYGSVTGTASQGACQPENVTFDMHCPVGSISPGLTVTASASVTPTSQTNNTYASVIAYPSNAPQSTTQTVFSNIGPRRTPPPADFDGNGSSDRSVYRNGAWYINGQATVFFGLAGDIPVPGDYDGDGTTDRSVFRNGAWYTNGQATVFFGLAGDIPVPGDYNGDGITDRAVFRPSSGAWYTNGQATVFFGLAGDIPVPGDYDGDGTTDRAVFRNGGWYTSGQATVFFGLTGDIPLPLPQAIHRTFF